MLGAFSEALDARLLESGWRMLQALVAAISERRVAARPSRDQLQLLLRVTEYVLSEGDPAYEVERDIFARHVAKLCSR